MSHKNRLIESSREEKDSALYRELKIMKEKKEINHEFFQISRVLLAIAQCDAYLSKEEIGIIFANLSEKGETTKEQEEIFEDDINNPKDVVELLAGIDSDIAKATMVFQICMLPFADKYVDKQEKETVLRILDNLKFDEDIKEKAREFIKLAAEFSVLLARYI